VNHLWSFFYVDSLSCQEERNKNKSRVQGSGWLPWDFFLAIARIPEAKICFGSIKRRSLSFLQF
jgi:hypothetical protein